MENNNYYHYDNMFLPGRKFGNHFLVQIGRIYCKEGQGFDNHLHINWYELTYVTRGSGTIYTNNIGQDVHDGDIYLSFPTDTHKIVSSETDPLHYYYISFYTEDEILKTKLEDVVKQFADPLARVFNDNRIKDLISAGINEFYNDKQDFFEETVQNILKQIMIYVVRDFGVKTPVTSITNINRYDMLCYQIMNYIDTHIFEMHKPSDITLIFQYNYSYLSEVFSRHTHQTLQDYYMKNKLNKARQLICEHKLSITEIAETLNFSSVYVFSKAYKKVFGISPSKDKL